MENQMNQTHNKPKILVLGGRGFIGRHIVKHLKKLGAEVLIGTRKKPNRCGQNERSIRFHTAKGASEWHRLTREVDTVINAVGILRERFFESYESVHHMAVANLAEASRVSNTRLIHISTLGLENDISSRFLTSKKNAESALKKSASDWAIIRPSVIDGDGGFGAKWFRRLASWPIHLVPAHAKHRITPLTASDLGEAIAKLAVADTFGHSDTEREYNLGGNQAFTLIEYLAALAPKAPIARIRIPSVLARFTAHICDLLHVTPYSFGHHDLLRRDNVALRNRLNELLGRPACRIGPTINPSPPLGRLERTT